MTSKNAATFSDATSSKKIKFSLKPTQLGKGKKLVIAPPKPSQQFAPPTQLFLHANQKIGSYVSGSAQLRKCPSSQCQKYTSNHARDCVHCGANIKCSKCPGTCSCIRKSDLRRSEVRKFYFQHQNGKTTPLFLFSSKNKDYNGQAPSLFTQETYDPNARYFQLQCYWYQKRKVVKQTDSEDTTGKNDDKDTDEQTDDEEIVDDEIVEDKTEVFEWIDKVGLMFGRFPSTDETEVIEWVKTITNVQLCFQEIVEGPQRVWLDIETDPDNPKKQHPVYTIQEWKIHLDTIVDTASFVLFKAWQQTSEIATIEQVKSGWVIYESHGKTKRSNHAIHSMLWFQDHEQQKHFQNEVQRRVPEGIQKYVDPCANSARGLRIAYNYKFRINEQKEMRPLIISADSPVKRDLLAKLPGGGDPLYKVVQTIKSKTINPKAQKTSNAASGFDGSVDPIDVQNAFNLVQMVTNPLRTYNLTLRPTNNQVIFHIDVEGMNASGYNCIRCDATHAHEHNNSNWFMAKNDAGFWSLSPYSDKDGKKPQPLPKQDSDKDGKKPKQDSKQDGKTPKPKRLLLGPGVPSSIEAPKDITTVILNKHEKLFVPFEQLNNPQAPKLATSTSQDVRKWLIECGFDITQDIDGPSLEKLSFQEIAQLAPNGTDPVLLHYLVAKARSGSSFDWKKYPNIVVESLCNTMKTRRLTELLDAYFTQYYETHGVLPKIIFITVRRPQSQDFCGELSAWFKAWTEKHFHETIDDGFTSYMEIADDHEAIRNSPRLVIQAESIWKLLQAFGSDSFSAMQSFGGVLVMDEITSIAKQLSSTTMQQLHAVALGMERLIIRADVRVFLDLIIDERTWDIVSLAPNFQTETIFYRNTFKLNHTAQKPREAYRVFTDNLLQAGALQDLEIGLKTAFVHSSRSRMMKFAKELQLVAQEHRFSAIIYTGVPTYLAVPSALKKHMTQQEIDAIKIFPSDRLGHDVFGYVDDIKAPKIEAINTKDTLNDVKRWWNMPEVRFTGWTSSITVGISNSLDPTTVFDYGDQSCEWKRIYLSIKPNGPTVRDLIQSHWRHRRAEELYYFVDTSKRPYGASSFNRQIAEHEVLRQLSVACDTPATADELQETLWSSDWKQETARRIKFIQNDTAKRLKVDWTTLPKWLQSVHLHNLIEEKRTNLLLEVEVQRYIVEICGYTIKPLLHSFPTFRAPQSTLMALSYQGIRTITDEEYENIKQQMVDHSAQIDVPDMYAFRRYQFDNLWFPNATDKQREHLFNTFCISTNDSKKICNYDNIGLTTSPEQTFHQVVLEMRRRIDQAADSRVPKEPTQNPLHINPCQKRLDCVLQICQALELSHSQDVSKPIGPTSFAKAKAVLTAAPQLRPSKLWGSSIKETPDINIKRELHLLFRRWSGMDLTQRDRTGFYDLTVPEDLASVAPYAHLIGPKMPEKECMFPDDNESASDSDNGESDDDSAADSNPNDSDSDL